MMFAQSVFPIGAARQVPSQLETTVIEVSATELEFLSNEPIEGESLADRLAQNALPDGDALRDAIEIGTALNRAHRQGIVHGKLSAHAILLTSSGARIVRPREGADLDALPYRSPEQVMSDAADCRSDIFAFGALLYEMVSGRRAFSGDGPALNLAILQQSPPALMGKSRFQAAMEGVIAACLEKKSRLRRQRIQNAVIELKLARPFIRPAASPQTNDNRPKNPPIPAGVPIPNKREARSIPAKRRWLGRWLWLTATAAAVATAVLVLPPYLRSKTPQVFTFNVIPPGDTTYRMVSVSPDGRYLAMQAPGPQGKPVLWLRSLDTIQPVMIAGSEGGSFPFWSPDGEYLAFFSDRALKRVPRDGGAVERICDAEDAPGGGSWNRDGTILFAPGQGSALFRVAAFGGKPEPVFELNLSKLERAHLWPQFLPDGRHFLFFVLAEPGTTGVYSGALDSPSYQLLFDSETNAVYAPRSGSRSHQQGYLLYIRDRNLMGLAFDASRRQVQGDPIRLQEDVGALQSLSLAPVSASENGVLVLQSIGTASRQLAWMDRSGKTLATVRETGAWGPPRISPDGTRAIAAKLDPNSRTTNLWMIDQAGNLTEFTHSPTPTGSPVWSPDGARVAYFASPEGHLDLFLSPANNGGKAEPLLKTAQDKYPTDWSRDGRYLLFGVHSANNPSDIWAISPGDRQSGPILDTIYAEDYAALSPNGKWLAFQSDESGRFNVYVQPFDGISHGTKRRDDDISNRTGGALPHWSADGKELFYVTDDGRIMSVNVRLNGNDFEHDAARPLFQVRPAPRTWNFYDVSGDGQRFLVNVPMEWSGSPAVTVMTEWNESLKKK